MTASASAPDRLFLHQSAQSMIDRGDYSSALSTIHEALKKYGPHVLLLCNKATCEFALGQIALAIQTKDSLLIELENNSQLISKENQAKCLLEISKFFENTGEISQSWELIQKIKSHYPIETLSHRLQYYIYASDVRLHSLMSYQKNDAGLPASNYFELSQMMKVRFQLHDFLEGYHALILFHLEQNSYDVVTAMIHDILQSNEVHAYDKSLILYDVLEILWTKDATQASDLLKAFQIPPQNPFEMVLHSLVRGDRKNAEKIYWSSLSQLTLAERIRLSTCLIKESENKNFWQFEFTQLISQLSDKSKNVWSARATKGLVPELIFSLSKCTLQLHQHTKKLKDDHPAIYILNEFCKGNLTLKMDELIRNIWKLESDESTFNRLRISLRRLEQDLIPNSQAGEIFKLTKSHVKLASEYIFKQVP